MHKKYGHIYPSILCIKNKSYTLRGHTIIQFVANKRYAFNSISYDTTGSISEDRLVQIVAEDGYKVNFMGEELMTYFNIEKIEPVG